MILKYFEIEKIHSNQNNFLLLYGKNEGFKSDVIKDLIFKNKTKEIINYHEKEIMENQEDFYNSILSNSLFNNKKFIIINYASDKIFKIIEELSKKKTYDVSILLNAGVLEKKSKLRSLFEKNKKFICIAFYPDNNQTLSKLANNFFRERKILISQLDINLIVSKCNGERMHLKNELKKIELFISNKKKISHEEIIKIINLSENHSIAELIDSCLIKNEKKTIKILNENNFNSEDCILITRTFLNKLKKILKLSQEYEKTQNLNQTILNAKPPIFWKDKEIIMQQLTKWKSNQILEIIIKLNDIELQIKKNSSVAINIIPNFIFEKFSLNN